MKKTLAVTTVLCLLLALLPAVPAQGEDLSPLFISRQGGIFYSVPVVPTVMRDMDMPQSAPAPGKDYYGGWSGKVQLHASGENYEWQLHAADISGMLSEVRKAHPGAEEAELEYIALENFATLCRNISSPNKTTSEPVRGSMTLPASPYTLHTIDYTFQYNDTPGAPFRCCGFIEGGNAVVVLGSDNAQLKQVLDLIRPVTKADEEQLALRLTPQILSIGTAQCTFPAAVQPQQPEAEGGLSYFCYTERHGIITLDYLPWTMNLQPGATKNETVLHAAEAVRTEYTNLGQASSLTLAAPGVAMLVLERDNGWRTTWEINLYTLEGLYQLYFTYEPDMRAFMDSIRFTGDSHENAGEMILSK